MELKDYEKLAKANGKVICVIDRELSPYRVGQMAGFSPSDAFFYHQQGRAHPVGCPVEYPVAPPAPPPEPESVVAIPDNWRTMNRLALARIVCEITGEKPSPAITMQRCIDVIEAELARREGPKAPAPAPVQQSFPAVRAGSFPS